MYAQARVLIRFGICVICFEFCFVSCSGGVLVGRGRLLSCYRDLDFFSGCTCILKMFDEQRHLVWRF